tara:strand:+ start:2510 stop:3229 length:720 start_codon:yes stop_codon:yes gene_type:complete
MRQVLITGGGTGIGRAIAWAFAEDGAAVTIAGRRVDVLNAAAEGRNITCIQADVTNEVHVREMFQSPFDVVVANAGWGTSGKTAKLSLAEWNATLTVNLTGTFLTFREALRSDPSPSRLIAIASTASLKGNASVPAYTAAKHGVLGLVRSIALDIAQTGATCNAICPGFCDTDLAETAIKGIMDRFDMDRATATAKVAANNPRGDLISPDEIAQTALFLSSEGGAAINGHALSVSGGEL